MATTRVQLPDGNYGEFPSTMSQSDIEGVLQRQYPPPANAAAQAVSSRGASVAAPRPRPHTLVDSLEDAANPVPHDLSSITSAKGPEATDQAIARESLKGIGNVGSGLLQVVEHPIRTAESMGRMSGPGVLADIARGRPTAPQEMGSAMLHAPLETLEQGVGQTAALGGAGEVVGAAPDIADAAGGGLKRLGAKVSDISGVGSNAWDRRFGATPGAALSEGRIIGATKGKLASKVAAQVPAIADERAAILQQSSAPPTNIRTDVDQPFRDLTSKVTNPKTGVAAPSDIAALTRTRTAAHFQQDPVTGKPLLDPSTRTPVPMDLEHMSPAEIAEYNSNLRAMGNYEAADSPLADQAIKTAGHNLRTRLSEVAPESTDSTRRLYNAETAQDILQRQLGGSQPGLPWSPYSAARGLVQTVVTPVARLAGTAAGAGLDAVGSGLRSLASKVKGVAPAGPPPAGAPKPTPPPPTLPAPQMPLALPETAGISRPATPASPPPNVSLTERVGTTPEHVPGGSPVQPGIRPAVGPDARVTTRTPTGFGPKVAAPAFTIPPKLIPEATDAIRQPEAGSILQHEPENAGGQGGGRGGVESGIKGNASASHGGPRTLASKVVSSEGEIVPKTTYYGHQPIKLVGDSLLDKNAEFPHIQEWIKQQRVAGRSDDSIDAEIERVNSPEAYAKDDAEFIQEIRDLHLKSANIPDRPTLTSKVGAPKPEVASAPGFTLAKFNEASRFLRQHGVTDEALRTMKDTDIVDEAESLKQFLANAPTPVEQIEHPRTLTSKVDSSSKKPKGGQ